MRVLLLSCCAPCSCAVIEKMAADSTDFAVLFYNPNIWPDTEYQKRLAENRRLCEHYKVPFIDLDYDSVRWQVEVAEKAVDRIDRCSRCFRMRLEKAMEYAKENGFTHVASVLGVSRHKNLDQVNWAASDASKATDVPYLAVEGRKGKMSERRAWLTRELQLYSQNYCGCELSMNERAGRRATGYSNP